MNRNKEYRLKRKSLRKDYIIQDKNVKINRLYYLNENKKAKLEELQQENKQLKQALLDIKEYIQDYIKKSNSTYTTVEEQTIIDIVNKALGDKE